jgi:hypothetical protein
VERSQCVRDRRCHRDHLAGVEAPPARQQRRQRAAGREVEHEHVVDHVAQPHDVRAVREPLQHIGLATQHLRMAAVAQPLQRHRLPRSRFPPAPHLGGRADPQQPPDVEARQRPHVGSAARPAQGRRRSSTGTYAAPVPEVVVVGAGLAGLACALHLTRAGVDVDVHEAEPVVGGRVRTDVVDGMLLDRGFQVHNTGYPEAQRVLDHDALRPAHVRARCAGAVGDRLHRVGDPRRVPTWAATTLRAPIGGIGDKLRVARSAAQAALTSPAPSWRVRDHDRAGAA